MANPPIPENGATITADWMQQALTAGEAFDFAPVSDVVVEDIGSGVGLLGEILRCHLTYRNGIGDAPERVVVKLPSRQQKNLRMAKRLRLHKREYDYYRHVAPHNPLRSPALLYGDFDQRSDRFVFVLEDLRGMIPGGQEGGASAAQARTAIRALAQMHGTFWGKVDRAPISGLHDSTTPKQRVLVQMIYLVNLVPTLNHFGEFFSDEMRRLAEGYGARIADHLGGIAAGPRTFIHGDFRMGNIFFGAGNEGDIAVIDWQVSGIGSPLYDVAYFLGGSVSTEVRREIERDVLEEYHDIVCGMGVKGFTFEDCWRIYRQNMLGRLLISIFVCGGLDLSDERSRELAKDGLRLSLAAIDDLDAADFLPARRPFLSGAGAFAALSRGVYAALKAVR